MASRPFLCHSSGDRLAVRELYDALKRDGHDPWLDSVKLLPGQEWQTTIRRAVKEADVVIVCLSKDSTSKSGFVQKEIKFALDIADEHPEGRIYVIPARLESCNVPDRLARWQRVDLFEVDGYTRLIAVLEKSSVADRSEATTLAAPGYTTRRTASRTSGVSVPRRKILRTMLAGVFGVTALMSLYSVVTIYRSDREIALSAVVEMESRWGDAVKAEKLLLGPDISVEGLRELLMKPSATQTTEGDDAQLLRFDTLVERLKRAAWFDIRTQVGQILSSIEEVNRYLNNSEREAALREVRTTVEKLNALHETLAP